MLKPLALTLGLSIKESDKVIMFPAGGQIEIRSAHEPDSLRGIKIDHAILDEAALTPEVAWYAAIRPALMDSKGSALFISTPRGRNWLWRLYCEVKDNPEWSIWQLPTYTNPFIPKEEIEALKEQLPDQLYRQEVLAEFIDFSGSVFSAASSCATATPQDCALPHHQYIIGVDWGKRIDFTVFVVLDASTLEVVYVERTQADYMLQLEQLRQLYHRFKPILIAAEQNAMGDALIEQLLREQLPVKPILTTHLSKQAMLESLQLAFESRALRIIPDTELLLELEAIEAVRTPTGVVRYSAPSGVHDDLVMALAFAWSCAGCARSTTVLTAPRNSALYI